jgi:hypothetical protein
MTQQSGRNEKARSEGGMSRKPYRTPQIITYGDLAEVTKNQGTAGAMDNPSDITHKTH